MLTDEQRISLAKLIASRVKEETEWEEIEILIRYWQAKNAPVTVSELHMLGYELQGVIIDVEQGHGFDEACLDTIKRVRNALAVKE